MNDVMNILLWELRTNVQLYQDVAEKRYMMDIWGDFFMIACESMFLYRFLQVCVHIWWSQGRFSVVCEVAYVRDEMKTRVIHVHWIIQNWMKYMEKCTVLSYLVESDVRSHWNVKDASLCEICLRNCDGEHYTVQRYCMVYYSLFFGWFIVWLYLVVNGSMEHVEAKKFVIFWSWWRIDADANIAFNKISENLSTMGFEVDINKLQLWSCVQQLKCLRIWSSCIAVIMTSMCLSWGVDLFAKTLFIVECLS